MRHIICAISLFLMPLFSSSQQNTLLLNSFFKDHLLDNSVSKPFRGTSFLPAFESEYDLNYAIRDSSKQYYELTEILFKKHLFEARGSNYFITISPVADLARGKDREDTNVRTLFQNTRGILVEGDLFTNFSFSTAIFENQARFSNYETAYYSSIGELYPNQSNGKYTTQNAVIPGSARTKPFDTDGFDYGYAVGNIVYKPHRSILICAGNTSQFIGDGYRSLFLSDNSVPAPFFRTVLKISDKLQFNYMRMRLMNLMRRPVSTSAESYYESKAFSVNYLTYQPTSKIALSLFEGVIWSRGDSITSVKANPLFYSPVPGIAGFILDQQQVNSILGLNLSILPAKGHRLYGQFAIGNLGGDKIAYQLGYRGYALGGIKNLFVQLEYNNVSKDMYQSANSRLNYSHYNLPLAEVKGSGFQEFIIRSNYEWKRIYADLKFIYYILQKNYSETSLLPVQKSIASPHEGGTIQHTQLEIGYRFNRKMNLSIFGSVTLRNYDVDPSLNKATLLLFGLRTGINNHYSDF